MVSCSMVHGAPAGAAGLTVQTVREDGSDRLGEVFHLSVPAPQAKLAGLFTSFSKWETYGAAFKMVDAGEVTLEDVQDAASEFAGIKPSVVAMRRRNFIMMAA